MTDWKNIKIEGVVEIEKCVAEFSVSEMKYTPWLNFKVKIYESQSGKFTGVTNLMLKDSDGSPCGGIGYGNSVSEALEDTVNYFMGMLKERDTLSEEDFEAADPYDF